jgi:hypothetical protein
MTTAMDFCKFLYHDTPMYRTVVKRTVGHFVTDLDFRGEVGSPKEREEFSQFFNEELGGMQEIRMLGEEHGCFAADTKAVTRDGVFRIQDLVGKTVDVLSKGGVYRKADFKSFGVQELLEVEFSDGRKVLATPNHEWEVRNCSGKIVRIFTTQLRRGHAIERTVAARPDRNSDYEEGIRHGFVFGDGTLTNRGSRSRALFTGAKDAAVMAYFEGRGNPPRGCKRDTDVATISGLPNHYKRLPAAEASASYWYGFVSGFLSADGCVDSRDGCVVLTQKSAAVLQSISEQLPRIGMVAGKTRSYESLVTPPNANPSPRLHRMSYLTLLRGFMQEEDFLVVHHRDSFVKHHKPDSKYGKFVGIVGVKSTGRFEEVFCCVEMETHTFVIDNGVLTGNCYGNGFMRIFFPFVRTLVDRRRTLALYTLSMFPEEFVTYDYKTQTYLVPDPMRSDLSVDKRPRVRLTIRDTPAKDFSKIRLLRLDPRYVRLRHAVWGGSTQVQYSFPPDMRSRIERGVLFEVNRTPADVLRCVAEGKDYLFDEGAVFHLKNPTVMGISNDGWGLPEILAHYPTIHKIAVYNRIDESIGNDFLIPLRIITPDLQGITDSHRMATIANEWGGAVDRMVKEQRLDRTQINGFPFPCKLDSLGGDGKGLVPKDLKEFEVRQLLDGMGYPEELIRGSFNTQQMPAAIRMFESALYPLAQGLRNSTKFAVSKISRYMFGEAYDTTLKSPRTADDIAL